jgi:hypothetical protein
MNQEKVHLRRGKWSLKGSPVITAGLAIIVATAQAQQAGTAPTGEDDSAATNAANNPTTPKLTVEAQDYWMPSVSGLSGRGGSNGLQRNIVPIRTFRIENLFFTSSFPSIRIRTLRAGLRPGSAACRFTTCPPSSCMGRPMGLDRL